MGFGRNGKERNVRREERKGRKEKQLFVTTSFVKLHYMPLLGFSLNLVIETFCCGDKCPLKGALSLKVNNGRSILENMASLLS